MEQDIGAEVRRLTLPQKIAQLCGGGLEEVTVDGKFSAERFDELYPNGIGHLCQFASTSTLTANELAGVVKDLYTHAEKRFPPDLRPLLHEEVITGVAAKGAAATPQMIGMACTWNPELVQKNAVLTGENLRKLGASFALSPMVDVITDARWGRGEEGFGEDAYMVASFADAFITGLQSTGVAATAKHYAGYGVKNQEDEFFYNETLHPFEAAIQKSGVKTIMPGYHQYHGVPCSCSKALLRDKLRGHLRFGGVVVSDYGAVENIMREHHYCGDRLHAAVLALRAGVDIDLPRGTCYSLLGEAVRQKLVTEEEIDAAVSRVLAWKRELVKNAAEHLDPSADFDPPVYRKAALRSARESVVLLKNDGILPLNTAKHKKILVTGPAADSYYSLLGDYTYMGLVEFFHGFKIDRNNPKLVTLLDGVRALAAGKAELLYERGCAWAPQDYTMDDSGLTGDMRALKAKAKYLEPAPEPDLARALELAKESDVIIAAVGETRHTCGECCDRPDVELLPGQAEFIEKLCGTGKPVVLIVSGGRPQAISGPAKHCAAVLYSWYPGEEGGTALAEILFGAVNPSAKLAVTLPDGTDQVPVTYHDERQKPQTYPFGFGLSYTQFEYSGLRAPAEVPVAEGYFDVSFTVANTGKTAGAEITQLYAKKGSGEKHLIAFTKTLLAAGESTEVRVRVYLDSFARYDADGILWSAPQSFTVEIGASSRDIRLSARVNVTGEPQKLAQRGHYFAQRM
jgi:beta-glucosidase